MKQQNLQHVFIIGCKGIPAHYGGFETFVDKLTEYQTDIGIQYHVACAAEPEAYDPEKSRYLCHKAQCTVFPWRKLGSARAIAYDLDALRYFIRYAAAKKLPNPVFYILACRIGPFLPLFHRRLEALGAKLYVNPDGHEFLRAKWSAPVRRYWKYSERLMVKYADLMVCDSKNMERYIQKEYARYHTETVYLAYGAETDAPKPADDDTELQEWLHLHGLWEYDYYLVVGRFVPENNYETMIREFMKSSTKKSFALITDLEDDFLAKLKKKTGFDQDPRIVFTGTVYDQELLKKIRERAYGYFHGHEVGGTNPSLLEALAHTNVNLLLDVGFNREVAGNCAFYWTKDDGSLAALIRQADAMSRQQISELGRRAQERIVKYYNWESIAHQYERLFHGF